ncbi:hypothetical protein [Telluribacter humicola]|uniref:hypothetical protein n=1 Tax=Telluribacter humicola TaxID=1720261 RepID=UPI001A96725D|nr:hypothetical protein [Telluribacter humicola]
MKTFNVSVIRTDEYEIIIDETVWDEKALSDWSKSFWKADSVKDIAESLAYAIMRGGSGQGFIEGFGYVKILRFDGTIKTQFGEGYTAIEDSQYTAGISLKLISEDEDFSYDTREIKAKKGGEGL